MSLANTIPISKNTSTATEVIFYAVPLFPDFACLIDSILAGKKVETGAGSKMRREERVVGGLGLK